MSLGQAFLEALESLSGNKLRSGLTVLGIVIGVAAVIAMLAVGKGAEASITGSIGIFTGKVDASALLKRLGVTLLLVEQNARVALNVCDRGYILEKGRIVFEGSAKDLRESPVTREKLGV